MNQVATILRQPQTGKPADDAEMTTIESLSDLVNLINEQAQRPNSQQSQSPGDNKSDEEMQFLMQMMRNSANARAMAAKPATGMNARAARPTAPAGAPTATRREKAPGTRDVRKAGGVMEEPPAEFRDALENYYHGIDQSR